MQGSKWTEIVVVYAEIFVVVDSELGGQSAEFFVVFFLRVQAGPVGFDAGFLLNLEAALYYDMIRN